MSVPDNLLRAVQTYQESLVAAMTNQNCFMDNRISNKRFKDFENFEAQLGETVTYDLFYRFVSYDSLVATFQAVDQRFRSLTVNKQKNVSIAYTAQQFIFNLENYKDRIVRDGAAELGAVIEKDIASIIPDCTYRFFGDGNTAINSYGQLALMIAYFQAYGANTNNLVGILDSLTPPTVIETGLNQFAVNRNNEIANSWELGPFSGCDWFKSNLLPIHNAGYAGQSWANGATGITLDFVSINGAGTQITFSNAGSQSDFFKAGDLIQFDNNISYLTYVGHAETGTNPVQVRVTADADSSGGTVVVNIEPALVVFNPSNPVNTANLPRALTTDDTAVTIPTHKCGLLMSGNPLMLAMPMLPEEVPYPTARRPDPETGVSVRSYYGSKFGENFHGLINDALWGKDLIPENAMRIVIPIAQ